jgi:predicted double-glycine peptidase/uncharacterized membrane protein
MQKFRLLKATRQSTEYSCGASALQSVLSYWGKDLDEEELMKLLKTTPETGTYPEDIIRVARELGFVAELKENLSIEDLEKSTNKGIPVIALGQAWRSRADANKALEEDWQDGHYVVILATDKDYVYFEDPFIRMGKGFMPKKRFEKHWHNIGGRTPTDASKQTHLGIIIRGDRPANKSLKQLDFSHLDFSKIGPLHLIVIEFQGELMPYDLIEKMKSTWESGVVRPIAAIALIKDKDGKLTAMEGGGNISGDEIIEMAAVVAAVAGLRLGGQKTAESMARAAVKEALIGDFGLSEELIQQKGKELSPNSSVFIVLFEHRWAKKLKDIAIREYGGTVVDQKIISDEDIAQLGSRLQEAGKVGGI